MSNTAAIVIAVVGSSAFTTLITAFLDWIKNRKKKSSPIEEGLMWLLNEKLEFLMGKYMKEADEECEPGKQPFISKKRVRFVKHGYDHYKALGGNGDLDDMYKDFRTNYKTDYTEGDK